MSMCVSFPEQGVRPGTLSTGGLALISATWGGMGGWIASMVVMISFFFNI